MRQIPLKKFGLRVINEYLRRQFQRLLKSRKGQRLSADKINKDLKAIYGLGYFEGVEVYYRRAPGGLALIFSVKEKPAVSGVEFEGNDALSSDSLKEVVLIKESRFIDEKALVQSAEKIKEKYRNEGFKKADVQYEVVDDEKATGQVKVVYKIDEGDKVVVREIAFSGNEVFSDSELADVISTRPYFWLVSWVTGRGTYRRDQLKYDAALIKEHYLNHGYVEIKIADPIVEELEEGDLKVTYKIFEGPVYSIGSLDAEGALVEDSKEKTLADISLAVGETFSVDKMRKDAEDIRALLADVGYAFADVKPQTRVDYKNQEVDLLFDIESGPLVYIDQIEISGNKKTRDKVIRRELRFEEQDLYSYANIKKSERFLKRLGYFEDVAIDPERIGKSDRVKIGVAVKEGQTGSFSIGAGASSSDGFVFLGRVQDKNFLGTGNEVALEVNAGSETERYLARFFNPRIADTHWSAGVEGFSLAREFDEFDRKRSGGGISIGYPLWFLGEDIADDFKWGLRYELVREQIEDVEDTAPPFVMAEEGGNTVSSATLSLVRNTIDNPLSPTEGSRQLLSFEQAGLGGDRDFWVVRAANTIYFPLFNTSFGSFVLANRTSLDYAEATDRTVSGESARMPLSRRFFSGGINSVRGYEARSLGPTEQTTRLDSQGRPITVEIGGAKQLVNNIELLIPILKDAGLKGLLFYDIGNAFDDDENIDFKVSEFRRAVGWGFRWKTPLAPFRIEIGYPLDRPDDSRDSDGVQVHFSVGAPL